MNKKYINCILALVIANCIIWCTALILNNQKAAKTKVLEYFNSDIAELKGLNKLTTDSKMTMLDPFFENMQEVIKPEVLKDKGICAFIAFDGDGFGKMREKYGSTALDEFVVEISRVLRKHFPENEDNYLCNTGDKSDEFYMFIMNRTSKEQLIDEIADFQQAVREIHFDLGEAKDVHGTISIGIAFYPDNGTTLEELYENSDAAGLVAKSLGKDCYHVSDATPEQ